MRNFNFFFPSSKKELKLKYWQSIYSDKMNTHDNSIIKKILRSKQAITATIRVAYGSVLICAGHKKRDFKVQDLGTFSTQCPPSW